jgi:short-subunit dehydrogenase
MTSILITGASSGIGAALARAYARPQNRLVLWGRNAERLEATAADCRSRGAETETATFDLTDLDRLVQMLAAADEKKPLDLVIFNAGLGGSLPHECAGQDLDPARRMAAVNFMVPVIGANLMAQRMAERGAGRLVFLGSVAGSFPLPMAPLYSGSKAGVELFAEALHLRLGKFGVGVTLVSPGFIDTPMSCGLTEPQPFRISANKAAAIIVNKIARGARHIVVPWQYAVIVLAAKLIPRAVVRAVLTRF